MAWAHESNYRSVQLLGYLHWQCQEYVLGRVGQEDVAVANIELVYLAIALHLARSPEVAAEIQRHLHSRSSHVPGTAETQHSPNGTSELNLEEVLRRPTRTVREPPRWFRGSLRQAFATALHTRDERPAAAWKLFVLVPRMLLRSMSEFGQVGKKQFFERMRRFQKGDWEALLAEAAAAAEEGRRQSWELDAEAAQEMCRKDAERKVQLREISRARMLLTSSGLAPGDEAALDKFKDPERRPANLPAEAVGHRPDQPLKLDRFKLLQALRMLGGPLRRISPECAMSTCVSSWKMSKSRPCSAI